MSMSIKMSVLVTLQVLAIRALAAAPPRLEVAVADPNAPLTFIVYGDTRFTQREGVANPVARRALIGRIASEKPAVIVIGGDLVYDGSNPEDYETYRTETEVWSQAKIPIFTALGNHEFRGCDQDASPCLENWWRAAAPSGLRPFRWYSVALGPKILVLVLDSDSPLKSGTEQRSWFEQQITHPGSEVEFVLVVLHYPPVRDLVFPRAKDEAEIERYLSKHRHSLQTRVVVVGSHVHNYERFLRNDVTYLVSGGGGAKPVPVLRLFGELSRLHTGENFHYIRFRFEGGVLQGSMVRFEAGRNAETAWTEPDRFEIKAKDSLAPRNN
jgi:predicted MPP superfamily phosphohydrolase